MFNINHYSKQIKSAVIAMLVMLTLIITSSDATAQSSCKKVNGHVTLQPVVAGCTSPVGLCAIGTYKGDIKGNSEFTGTSLAPVESTATLLLVGDNVIHTTDGDLATRDVIVLSTNEVGDFAEVDTVTSASTGEWAGASGVLKTIGTFTAAGGEGDYIGEVCTP
jgi:hypothetical protein